VTADLIELIADHPVTSIGLNLVDLATANPLSLPLLVEKGAVLLAEVAAQVSTRAAP
jgi:hypothetical protein